MMNLPKGWTLGAEHEVVDWDRNNSFLMKGMGIDERDVTMVNSNGIAVDPRGRVYGYGGEINTFPTHTIDGQLDQLAYIKEDLKAKVNYRSNLHIHVQVPGLRNDLVLLKRVLQYYQDHHRFISDNICPVEMPFAQEKEDSALYSPEIYQEGLRRRIRRAKKSHHNLAGPKFVEAQLYARTTSQFFDSEFPLNAKGELMRYAQPRAGVNLRQLLETGTVEFRHFVGTLEPEELSTCIEWCVRFLQEAIGKGISAERLFKNEFARRVFPKYSRYRHWMEVGYRSTVHDGTIKKEIIVQNIKEILNGTFNFSIVPRKRESESCD